MFPVSCSSPPIIRKEAIWRDAQSEDITSSINIWQMLCWEPSYCNSYSNIFFLKAAYKLKFPHYMIDTLTVYPIQIVQSRNYMHLSYLCEAS